jgi:hypothetical protein
VWSIACDKDGAFRVMEQGGGAQLRVGDCSKATLRKALHEAYDIDEAYDIRPVAAMCRRLRALWARLVCSDQRE